METTTTPVAKVLVPIGAVLAVLLVTITLALGAWAVHCL
jgi:hypothetical protein